MEQAFQGKRTDLALEAREQISDDREIDGVVLKKKWKRGKELKVTQVQIKNANGARIMGKPEGNYITIEAKESEINREPLYDPLIQEIILVLDSLISKEERKRVLVAGLGNREVTPDALGPLIVDNLLITRHLKGEGIISNDGKTPSVSAIAPGVTGQTGMEVVEIMKGILNETSPSLVIAIDALAARSVSRLNCTVQLTDTGISPGSGVGNHRKALNRETLGVKVIAIGVPTVVDAATIVEDRMEEVLLGKGYSEKERELFLREINDNLIDNMFVTPKNVDEAVKNLGILLSEALNRFFYS